MKRIRKRGTDSIVFAMMLALFFAGIFMMPERVFAKAAITTNVKGTITLTKGSSKILYLRNAGKVTWKSSRTSVATVNTVGKVTAKATGSAKITASASGKTWSCTVKVTLPVSTNVKGTYSLKKGSSKTLYVRNAGKVTWKTSKSSVASVNSSGKVTAKAVGSAKITASASGKTWSCTIKVTKPASSSGTGISSGTGTTGTQNLGLNTTGMPSADAAIFRKIYALHNIYYEGMRWTSANYYRWNGGIFTAGYGCSAFAFMASDAAFGKTAARRHYDFNNVKVGDILRIKYNTHSVIVLKVVGNQFVVAEGNYNSKVHWGRVLTRSEVRAGGTYVMTRR